jgi:hypothetical protein
MWITVAPGEEPLWEGKFVAIESEGSEIEQSYRDSSPEPALATESPGTVSIGIPQVFPIASVLRPVNSPPLWKRDFSRRTIFLCSSAAPFGPSATR